MTDAQLLLEVQEIKDNTKKLLLLVGGDLATGAKGVIQRLDDHEKTDIEKHTIYDDFVSRQKGVYKAFGVLLVILALCVSILAIVVAKSDKVQASPSNN